MEATLDKFGRVVIPKQIRDELGLKPGVVLQIEKHEEEILIKPVCGETHLLIKKGVLVFTGTATGDIAGAVKSHRQQRLDQKSYENLI